MPNPVTVSVRFNITQQVKAAVQQKVKATIAKTAFDIEAAAKEIVPVDTGNLRSSITTEIAGDGMSATVGTGVDYGVYVELGTSHMGAQPFLFPSAEDRRAPFESDMKAILDA